MWQVLILILMGGGETTKRDMFIHWSQNNLMETTSFQRDMNSFASEKYMTGSNWVKYILTNLSKVELKQQVDEKSNQKH